MREFHRLAGESPRGPSARRSDSTSVTGRSQTNPRQTYAAARPSTADPPGQQRDVVARGRTVGRPRRPRPGAGGRPAPARPGRRPAGPTTATSSGPSSIVTRGGERPAREPGRPLGQHGDGGQRGLGRVAVAPLTGQRVRGHERVHHGGEPRRRRVVAGVARPGDQRLGVVRGVEEAAVVGGEVLQRACRGRCARGRATRRHRSPGPATGSRPPRSRSPPARPRGDPRRRPATPAAAGRRRPGAARPGARRRRRAASTYSGSPSSSPASQSPLIASPFQAATTLSSRSGRTRSSRARISRRRTSRSRPAPGPSGSRSSCRVDAPCSKVPSSVTSKTAAAQPAVHLPERLHELGRGPGVVLALDALTVRVQGRREAALGGAQLADHEVRGLARHPLPQRAAPAGVEPEQLGVVVEHLLEVRHHPAGVHRVAREAAAELVVEPAAGHRLAGRVEHRPRPRRTGAAGGTRAPSTAGTWGRRRTRPLPVEVLGQQPDGAVEHLAGQRRPTPRPPAGSGARAGCPPRGVRPPACRATPRSAPAGPA